MIVIVTAMDKEYDLIREWLMKSDMQNTVLFKTGIGKVNAAIGLTDFLSSVEDIDRHHMHIVTIRVDENGKCLDSRYNYHRSKAITRDLEEKYNLHKADRKQRQADNPLRKVDVSQGNVKKQVANTVKSLCATYRFQSLGEYRALLSL